MSIVSDSENFLSCDFRSAFAFGWVAQATVSDHGFFRYYFLEAAVLSMLGQLYFAPIHGALVQRDGRGVLLCGDRYAGKSTLAYACARSGWTFISDDGTCLVRDRSDRYAVGNPHRLRFREDAKLLFPELRPFLPAERPNGKIAIEVSTNQLSGISTAEGCVIDHVVFLNRPTEVPKLVPLGAEAALSWFEPDSKACGTKDIQKLQHQAYRRLLNASVWELRYRDLDYAIARLERLVRAGE